MKSIDRNLWVIALVALVGCFGTETGNPPFSGEIAVDAHSSDPATAALRSSGGGITVTGVWLGLVPGVIAGNKERNHTAGVFVVLAQRFPENRMRFLEFRRRIGEPLHAQ